MLLGRVGRAGLPGAFWCASPFFLAALSFCFAWPPPGWVCPGLGPFAPWFFLCSSLFCVSRWAAGCCPPPPPFCGFRCFRSVPWFFFSSSSFVRPRFLRVSLVSGPGCRGPRRCVLFALLAFRFSALRALSPLSCFLPGRWLLRGGCCPPPPPPPPPPFVSRGFRHCHVFL